MFSFVVRIVSYSAGWDTIQGMQRLTENEVNTLVQKAALCRSSMVDENHETAFRVFSGFFEGIEDIVADIYGTTLVIFSYCDNEEESYFYSQTVRDALLQNMPWIKCVVVKHHNADDPALRKGEFTFGGSPDRLIRENGVSYAIDLALNQDASFYLDTRLLRQWLLEHSDGLEVLNTFAYTGSLGVAALAGGAQSVVQVDRNRRFLDLARQSAMLNRLDLGRMKLRAVDFFVEVGQLKRSGRLFDLVIVDPPFFSVTEKGMVDQMTESSRLINKIRPLVRDGGKIIAINNAVFLPGKDYFTTLSELGKDGFLSIDDMISIPEDIIGFSETIERRAPVDPSPFNHSTKIIILNVKRKS